MRESKIKESKIKESSIRECSLKENRAENRKKNIGKQLYQGNEKQQRNTDWQREKKESASVKKSENPQKARVNSGDRTKDRENERGPKSERPEKAKKTGADRGASSPCKVAGKCGGCKWIHKPYKEQLRLKEGWVRELMEPFCKLEPIIGMEEEQPMYYRNKVHAVFGEDRRHNPISGIYEEGTHRIVPVDSCMIENQTADKIIVSIRELLKSFKIRPYNEDTGYGLLRHVLIRTGLETGQIMVVLVLTSPILPSRNNFVKALLALHPEITTIVININDKATSMVLGEKEKVIYGKGYIEDRLLDMTFRISPKSFYQVNPVQTRKLYTRALEYASLTGKETVVDAYCGTGTIGLLASKGAGKVIGVELNPDAVRDARINAAANNVKNITFYQNDAGRFLTEMAAQAAKADVILLDPPRSGSDEAFLNSVALLSPERIVYISCGPETLVRDIKYLQTKGYGVKKGTPVDMFPYTDLHHVEMVVLLEKNNGKNRKGNVNKDSRSSLKNDRRKERRA